MVMEHTSRESLFHVYSLFKLITCSATIGGERFGIAKGANLISVKVMNENSYVVQVWCCS
jgi:hypothetical protein